MGIDGSRKRLKSLVVSRKTIVRTKKKYYTTDSVFIPIQGLFQKLFYKNLRGLLS